MSSAKLTVSPSSSVAVDAAAYIACPALRMMLIFLSGRSMIAASSSLVGKRLCLSRNLARWCFHLAISSTMYAGTWIG